MITPVVRHLISGDAFFTGIGMIVVATIWRGSRWVGHQPMSTLLTLLGAAFILCSATPLPFPVYVLLGTLTMTWLVLGVPRNRPAVEAEPDDGANISQQSRPDWIFLTLMMIAAWVAAGLSESTWCLFPRTPLSPSESLIILGDSVTAGIGENEAVTWPRLLVRDHQLTVVDLSRAGETVGNARKRVSELELPPGVVIIELGGNDILGTTTVDEFRSQLDALLKDVSKPPRQILIFEIPLPPLGNRFGMVQRQLAARYHAQLIPKEVLADVLLSPETTLDSIHLTQTGHDRLAEMVWKIIRP